METLFSVLLTSHPFPNAPGVSSSPHRHGRRLPLYILSNIGSRLPVGSMEMVYLSLSRVKLVGTHLQPPRHCSFPGVSSCCIQRAHCLALYILGSLAPGQHAESIKMAELRLSHV